MRKMIGMAGALLLILPQVALAQGHEHGGGHPGGGGGDHGGGEPHGGGGEHRGGPPPGGGGHFGGGDNHHSGGDFRAQAVGGGGGHAGGDHHGGDFRGQAIGGGDRGGGSHHGGGDFHAQAFGGRPDGGFRGNFPRPSAGGWHRGFYAGQRGGWDRIRGYSYAYPRGWGYRRWGLGAILPGLLFGSAYYWNDYGTYGIYPPPPGDRWVRYGPDLLLINLRSGRVDDAIYGAFY